MKLGIPDALRLEHETFRRALSAVSADPGELGAAARELMLVLGPHVQREEAFALPPLGLLHDLAAGRLSREMTAVLPLTDRLRDELARLLAEHSQILAAARRLRRLAEEAGRPEGVALADETIQHAVLEEDVLYPVALLIGDYVKLRLGR